MVKGDQSTDCSVAESAGPAGCVRQVLQNWAVMRAGHAA
uniref:ISRm3/5 transposase n=1 Tax=Rhizobium meliloti TaxID=382 RepID=I2E195_RHIML|nr:ISRm3/5 transposase [Sinorhizobium meliloti]